MTRGYRRQNAEDQKTMIRKLQRVIYRLKRNVLAPAILRWFAVGLFHMVLLTYSWCLLKFDHWVRVVSGAKMQLIRKRSRSRQIITSEKCKESYTFSGTAILSPPLSSGMQKAPFWWCCWHVGPLWHNVSIFWHTSTEDSRQQARQHNRADSDEEQIKEDRFSSQEQLPCKMLRLMVSGALSHDSFEIL